jgi:hypothetical protein
MLATKIMTGKTLITTLSTVSMFMHTMFWHCRLTVCSLTLLKQLSSEVNYSKHVIAHFDRNLQLYDQHDLLSRQLLL